MLSYIMGIKKLSKATIYLNGPFLSRRESDGAYGKKISENEINPLPANCGWYIINGCLS